MSSDPHNDPVSQMDPPPAGKGYALSGKIMLSAIVVLFAVVVIMVLLHIYARWYLLRHNPHHHRRRRRRGSRRPVHHLVFYVDPTNFNSVIDTSPASAAANRRLDPTVLKSLPTFRFSSETKSPADPAATDEETGDGDVVLPECAVCLSEFEDGERGRLLPRCGHSFHVDCIDMWFHSHSTCPLCRSPVAAVDDPSSKIDGVDSDSPVEIVVNLSDSATHEEHTAATATPAIDSTAGSDDCHPDSSATTPLAAGDSSSSFGLRRKDTNMATDGFSIEIPVRSSSFTFSTTSADESSPGGSQGYRSPTSRILSLRRILSREKKPLSSPPPAGSSCSSPYSAIGSAAAVDLPDIEEGWRFEAPKTPR